MLVVGLIMGCTDAAALADFWKAAGGYVDDGTPGDGTAWLTHPRGRTPHLALIEVPETRR